MDLLYIPNKEFIVMWDFTLLAQYKVLYVSGKKRLMYLMGTYSYM